MRESYTKPLALTLTFSLGLSAVKVRLILISNMAKPEEVLVVVEDNEPRREAMKDTDTIELYKSMRVALGEDGAGLPVTLSLSWRTTLPSTSHSRAMKVSLITLLLPSLFFFLPALFPFLSSTPPSQYISRTWTLETRSG